MNGVTTTQAIAGITDEGMFERLATAVLRAAEPIYRNLLHPGVNADGKTVKSPLDGFHFVPGAHPARLIAVHHTITGIHGLEGKWLHDPSKVKLRKGPKPTAPAGDLLKTAAIVADERTRSPELRATLVLTTNQAPGESLVRKVVAEGKRLGIEIEFWSRSALAYFLDHTPQGQWLRHSYLGIEQELLSEELLHTISGNSLRICAPRDDPTARIPRALDQTLASVFGGGITFLVGESGFGKSVACHRRLADYVAQGGFALVVRDQTVSEALTVEQAITSTLRQLHPSLATVSPCALSFCSPERPLLLLIEDINKSGQPQVLVEKLFAWCQSDTKSQKGQALPYRIFCPLWPEVVAVLDDQTRKGIEPSIIATGGFTESEGRDAVVARTHARGGALSPLKAEEIARALGNDPLLIALHDPDKSPEPHKVIGRFVEDEFTRIAAIEKNLAANEYHQALQTLGAEMLVRGQIELTWNEISKWPLLQREPLRLISQIAHRGKMLAFSGAPAAQRVVFRHDRVRDWLLADAAADLDRQDRLDTEVVSDPYFAEVFGAALVFGHPKPDFLDRVSRSNPLALFYALKYWGQIAGAARDATLQAISNWLALPDTRNHANAHLRWEALAALAETDSTDVPVLVRKFPDRGNTAQLARLRNGDLSGGIELCADVEPGVGAPWRDVQIEHAKLRYGRNLAKALDGFFRQENLPDGWKSGALRLAGHIADPSLVLAIEHCWTADNRRAERLADYLWAFAQCCAGDPDRFLGPSCDLWASLSDTAEKDGMPSQRDNVASDQLRWAFCKWPPVAALDFFIQRASQTDLRWPITYMLHSIDHPKAVVFVARELGETQRQLEGTGSFSPFGHSAPDEWRRAQDQGRPMSQASREALRAMWADTSEDKHVRSQAFRLWSATKHSADINLLRGVSDAGDIADQVLAQRLYLGDTRAIPAFIDKLSTRGDRSYWWQWGRYIWSAELSGALDTHLERRRAEKTWTWGLSAEPDWIVSELVMRLPEREIERLLLKHWDHLRFSPNFVQAALYAATPPLEEAAASAIMECPEPSSLLAHIGIHFGIRISGRHGITRRQQIRAISPYLNMMSATDVKQVWDVCGSHGWIDLRRDVLDAHLKPPFSAKPWSVDLAVAELDKMVADKQLYWISLWIDRMMVTGVSWEELLSALKAWFTDRKSFEALQVVAAALAYRGTRQDLATLRIYDGMPENASKQVIADTEFAVRRRTVQ